ncbi:hypothetical protein BRADI_3g07307v3 [Brachypodium distachyon]|uniref:Reverse transcriptase zinc-binding domain-containing protein n=1 Tax=Brachypodium distachyon TaxID=15368 RepID=A0A0Q3F3B0_BRADI|nr:hypothetical protein BRADI_3g07307v3 [Brachypodium distachyon]
MGALIYIVLICLRMSEPESVQHLFFDCMVPQLIWEQMHKFYGKTLDTSLQCLTSHWKDNKKFEVINISNAAILWSTWKLRNDLFFRYKSWSSLQVLWRMVLKHLRSWKVLCSSANRPALEHILQQLEGKSMEIPRLLPG